MSDGYEFKPWTDEGAARLREAAAAVQAAIAAHAQELAAADGDNRAVFKASDDLLAVLVEYADAQFDFTGTSFPLGALAQYAEQGEGDAEHDEDEPEEWPTSGISVLQRHDYVVRDEDAVLEAGRRAYLRVWPDDDEAAAAADVTHIGRALYQVAHADGWTSLYKTQGLEPLGGFIGVVKQDELFGPNSDDWAAEVLDEGADLLYSQDDIYRAP